MALKVALVSLWVVYSGNSSPPPLPRIKNEKRPLTFVRYFAQRTEERGDSFFCPLCRCRNPPREPEIHEQTWTQNYLHDVESRSVAAVYFCRRIDLRRSSWSSFSIDSEWTPLADDGVGWLKLLDRFRIRSLEKMRGLSESSHP